MAGEPRKREGEMAGEPRKREGEMAGEPRKREGEMAGEPRKREGENGRGAEEKGVKGSRDRGEGRCQGEGKGM